MRTILFASLFLTACGLRYDDPNDTGLKIYPAPGFHEGPIDVEIINDSEAAVECQVYQRSACEDNDGDDFLDEGEFRLEVGEAADYGVVVCLAVDINCDFEDATDEDLPVRVWTWTIN